MVNRKENLILFLLVFFLSAVYVFVFSESGILERINYREKRAGIQQRIEAMKADNSRLSRELARLENGSFTDMELYRSGLVRKEGKLLFLGDGSVPATGTDSLPESVPDAIETSHLRILWVVLSALILLVYGAAGYRRRNE